MSEKGNTVRVSGATAVSTLVVSTHVVSIVTGVGKLHKALSDVLPPGELEVSVRMIFPQRKTRCNCLGLVVACVSSSVWGTEHTVYVIVCAT